MFLLAHHLEVQHIAGSYPHFCRRILDRLAGDRKVDGSASRHNFVATYHPENLVNREYFTKAGIRRLGRV